MYLIISRCWRTQYLIPCTHLRQWRLKAWTYNSWGETFIFCKITELSHMFHRHFFFFISIVFCFVDYVKSDLYFLNLVFLTSILLEFFCASKAWYTAGMRERYSLKQTLPIVLWFLEAKAGKSKNQILALDCMADKASLLAIKNLSRKAWCLKELSWNLLPAECRQIPQRRDSFHFHLLFAEDRWKVLYEIKNVLIIDRYTVYTHTSPHKCLTEAAYSQIFLSSSVQV